MNLINTAIILTGETQTSPGDPSNPTALSNTSLFSLLEQQIEQLINAKIDNIIISTYHLADEFDKFLSTKNYPNLNIFTIRQRSQLGTGGALKNTLLNTNTEQALVLNGNSFIDLDLDQYIKFHLEHIFKTSMILTSAGNTKDQHFFELDENQITDISSTSTDLKFQSAGVYILDQDVFNYIALQSFSLEKELLPFLCNENFGAYLTVTKIIKL
ncbi:MAG: NDP-sugar synthase [Halobacteriovoraceae bacterium]|jgi:D-glycero-alpha-D-manno-heptose 1-phosphate guanylyltransferase|nr:NDP-sugar synthase [Halobacteriovoraceae bacterium]